LKVLYIELEVERRPVSLSDFEILKCLGKGGSCAVYLVRNRRSCQLMALKQIPKEYISEYKRFEQILRERKILLQLQENKFTINCHAAFESDRHLNFIMDYCPGGELFYHIKDGLLANDASVKVYFC
jgi:serine/threonine protein kinase